MMNKIYQICCAGLVGLVMSAAFTACSPDEFDGVDPNGIPTIEGTDFTMTVDQETNQMIAHYTPQPGTYPIWILNGTHYSTLQEVGFQNPEAGTYTVELKLGNRNGFSQGGIVKSFTFNETKIDYTADFRRLCDKEWRFANKEVAHLACGPAGTAGTEWWSASADEKKDFGMYDDRITFTAETRKGGTFTYNAGEDGLTYVNTGTTKWGGSDADFDAQIGNKSASWSFEIYDWEDADGQVTKQTYIQLAPNTPFPYISSDAQYENPKFRIESLTAKKLVLIYETPERSIAWRFIFTSEEAEKEWSGFDANSDFNMWKGITPEMSFYYNPDPGWGNEQTALFASLFEMGNNDYTITIPNECYSEWQAQVHFHTNLVTSAAVNYDFSCVFNSDRDIDGVVVKLTNEDDSEAIIDAHDVNLKAGKDYIFWVSDVPGKDLNPTKLVLDFGHATGETHVNVTDIVLKNHADDDGTVPPNDDPNNPDQPVMDWDPASSANLWAAVESGEALSALGYYFADNGWSPISYTDATHDNGVWSLTLPEGLGGSQWQGQFHIDTKLTASASKTYNFYMVMEADNDCPGITFKLTDAGDTNFFLEERNDVKADEPFILKRNGVTLKEGKDAEAIRLFFDFGGSPAGTHIKISKIYFEENVSMSYDDADNLWKAVDDGSAFDAFGYYFADNNWSPISYSEVKHSGNVYELKLPDGLGGSQWQGQFHIDTKLTASASKSYNVQIQIEADNDLKQVTFKLTDAGDSNFFFEERKDVPADEPYVITWKGVTLKEGNDASALRFFFDFGGSPAGTNVKISKIILKEA